MPLPQGLDPALNADPRKIKASPRKPKAAKGTQKTAMAKAVNGDSKSMKTDKYAVERHLINMVLKTCCVVAFFFVLRSFNWVTAPLSTSISLADTLCAADG